MTGKDESPQPPHRDDELVPEDDAIIGRAVRRSLLVLIIGAAGVGGVLWFARRPGVARVDKPIPSTAPVQVAKPIAAPPAVSFTDITQSAGIDFVHRNGAYGAKLLPESMGGGVAFLDYDADGDADLLFVSSSNWPDHPLPGPVPTLKLYRNDGSGHFTDVTAAAGLAVKIYGMGVAVGDYDGDGKVDFLVTGVGENHLFHNLGGHFTDVTRQAGVAGDAGQWNTCATFFDADNDGRLDLFVCSYVRWSRATDFKVDYRLTGVGRAYGPPMNYEGSYAHLYRNRGDGKFSDVSAAAGMKVDNPATHQPLGKALGVAPIDVDGDGWMDLLVANDTTANFYFHNQRDFTFRDEGAAAGLAFDRMGNATGAMGTDAGYFRNDAELGFPIGNFANEMATLYVSQGDPNLFADEAISEGIGAPTRLMSTFGLFFFDYDLDGRLDLLLANGHLEEEIAKVDPTQTYRKPAQLFWNAGIGGRQTFVSVPPETTGDLPQPIVGRGAAYADIDGDGDLDVVLTQIAGAPKLLRNDQALHHHWLRVRLAMPIGNRDAIGGCVTVSAGGVTQRRQVMPTKSYLSQSELTLTFGLAEATRIDSLSVRWPGSISDEAVNDAPVDRTIVIEPGKGIVQTIEPRK